jgi:hypothetical protein
MKLKIFVRWDKSHDNAGGRVEVQQGEFFNTEWHEFVTVWSKACGNNERVYGYCMALVDMFRSQGHKISLPNCLLGDNYAYNRQRED